jgi:hypothetical protein
MIVQKRINEINTAAAPLLDGNRNIGGWNWLAMILGLPFFALSVWGVFLE